MSVHAVQCRSCGGAIAHEPGAVLPRCLFCGRDALEERELAAVEPPEVYLPFRLNEDTARASFRQWAHKRFWAPRSIRTAKVELSRLFLPAWTWSADLETHWAGLQRASTRSGKRPITGQQQGRIERAMVPSSPALAHDELAAISPFLLDDEHPLGDGGPPGPWEVGELTRELARQRGIAEMERQHGQHIADAVGAVTLHASSVATRVEGQPLLLPVFIGAYLHGDDSYRVVINGQTGDITGKAPISWGKVVLAILGTLFLAMAVLAFVASQ